MTDILQRYGIKEVADVTFYHIDDKTGKPDYPVLVLDSLKVTSIEQTAETAEARGGKGNAKLIVWDFGKEITVNIEDALFSPQSFSIMLADGKVNKVTEASSAIEKYIRRSARVVCTADGTEPVVKIDGNTVHPDEVFSSDTLLSKGISFYKGNGATKVKTSDFIEGEAYFAVWYHPVASKSIITITPDSFPGTYYVTGDTMVRSERSGEDEYFQFIIPKAKMQAEQTISMEAEGDPSTFNMSLQVLRPESGEMIQFIQYSFANDLDQNPDNNHSLVGDDGWLPEGAISAGSEKYSVEFIDKDGKIKLGVSIPVAVGGTTKLDNAAFPVATSGYQWEDSDGSKLNLNEDLELDGDIRFYERKITE